MFVSLACHSRCLFERKNRCDGTLPYVVSPLTPGTLRGRQKYGDDFCNRIPQIVLQDFRLRSNTIPYLWLRPVTGVSLSS